MEDDLPPGCTTIGWCSLLSALLETKSIEKMNISEFSRDDKDLEFFARSMILNMKRCYGLLLKDGAPEELKFENIVEAACNADDIHIETPLNILKKVLFDEKAFGNEEIAKSPLGPIMLCAIFAFRAYRVREGGLVERAWSYMADASFWCGVARTGSSMDTTLVKERKDQAAKGGEKRNEGNNELREYALQIARQYKKSWPSRSMAANFFLKNINDYAETRNSANTHAQRSDANIEQGAKSDLRPIAKSTLERWFYDDAVRDLFKRNHDSKS